MLKDVAGGIRGACHWHCNGMVKELLCMYDMRQKIKWRSGCSGKCVLVMFSKFSKILPKMVHHVWDHQNILNMPLGNTLLSPYLFLLFSLQIPFLTFITHSNLHFTLYSSHNIDCYIDLGLMFVLTGGKGVLPSR